MVRLFCNEALKDTIFVATELVPQLNTLLLRQMYPGIDHSRQHKANYYKKLRTNKVSAFLDF